jgi:NADPH-dependent curcumin reductase CurA
MTSYRRIILASRPTGAASTSNFRMEEVQTPTLQPGEMLVRNEWLSLDPYMRGRMNEGRSYAKPQVLGELMQGGTAGTVVESRHPQFKVGEKVVAYLGWQEYGVSDGTGVMKADTRVVPLSAYLGPVGMPGVTACLSLVPVGRPY